MLNQLPLYFLAIFALLPLSCHAVDSQTYGMYPDWSKNVGIYKVNVRQFSEEGTFGEVTEYLPKIKAMGIDLVWLMPIYEIGEKNRKGSLGSYYSIQDYKSVNPEFGNEEAGLDMQLLFFEKDLIDWRPHPEREQLTRLFHWKKRNQALWNGVHGGDFVNFKTGAESQVWAFYREKNGDKIVSILNLSPESSSFTINDSALAGNYVDVLTDQSYELDAQEAITLEPWGYWLLEAKHVFASL